VKVDALSDAMTTPSLILTDMMMVTRQPALGDATSGS
jgi:hypothetical protein